jgi:Uma2 family endonuclease
MRRNATFVGASVFNQEVREFMSTIEPQQKRWTRYEYGLAVNAGIFASQHLELLEGRIWEMTPMSPRRAVAVQLAAAMFDAAVNSRYTVRVQLPLAMTNTSEPQPDIAIVSGQPRDYAAEHPTRAELIVEISDSSLAYDRGEKLALYARCGVPEYWILNLCDDELEVYTQPSNEQYQRLDKYGIDDIVAPSSPRDLPVSVADLIP